MVSSNKNNRNKKIVKSLLILLLLVGIFFLVKGINNKYKSKTTTNENKTSSLKVNMADIGSDYYFKNNSVSVVDDNNKSVNYKADTKINDSSINNNVIYVDSISDDSKLTQALSFPKNLYASDNKYSYRVVTLDEDSNQINSTKCEVISKSVMENTIKLSTDTAKIQLQVYASSNCSSKPSVKTLSLVMGSQTTAPTNNSNTENNQTTTISSATKGNTTKSKSSSTTTNNSGTTSSEASTNSGTTTKPNTNTTPEVKEPEFVVNSDGVLIKYNYDYGTDVKVPAEVNGVKVKSISSMAFKVYNVLMAYFQDENGNDVSSVIITDSKNKDIIEQAAIKFANEGCDDCNYTKIEDVAPGGVFTSIEDYLKKYPAADTEYETWYIDIKTGIVNDNAIHKVTELDLSDAIYLESISEDAFYTDSSEDESVCGEGVSKCVVGTLTSLILPKQGALTSIERFAFSGNKLTNLTIPASVTSIGKEAFYNNSFKLASDITVLDSEFNSVTRFNSGWNNIGFPGSGPKGTKYDCFYVSASMITGYDESCSKNVVIPDKINNVIMTSIDDSAFQGMQLTSVTIPNSVTSIGNSAFSGNQLTSIIIPASVTSIGDSAFSGNQLTSVTIPASVISIGNSAFASNQLTSITIPASVTSIEDNAFSSNQLTSVTIPATVTTIGYYAFGNNQFLTAANITILANVTNLATRFDSNWTNIGFPSKS